MIANKEYAKDPFILIFDDECIMCNSFVSFVIKFDSRDKFRFAALQSAFAQEQLKRYENLKISKKSQTSFLIEKGKIYSKSTGILRVLRQLDGGWKYLSYLNIIPKMIRDSIYDRVSISRYLFGKKEKCLIPSPNMKSRFLGF